MTRGIASLAEFNSAVVEVLHYVDLYGVMPSAHRPVSMALSMAESLAVLGEYVSFGGLTEKGREFVERWTGTNDNY